MLETSSEAFSLRASVTHSNGGQIGLETSATRDPKTLSTNEDASTNDKLINDETDIISPLSATDYKDVSSLWSYLSELGHILPRVKTGLSSRRHRKLVKEIKKARYLGLLPFSLY
ncbi:30S ribosomal protein S18 [Candidatus Hodgkinia cicadicola]